MKIKKIKKEKEKYKIELENKEIITTYDAVILKNNILYKKELTKEDIKKIEQENKYYESYNTVLKYSSKRIRSEYEIKKYMKKQNIENQNEILKKLKEENIINDKNYTKAYIHDKIYLSQEGPEKIKKELIKQDIDENTINEELETIDQNEILKKLEKQITKKISNKKESEKKLKQKIINNFIELGYEKQDIIEIFEAKYKKNNEIIKNEYTKIYNKLKEKYEGEQLNFRIKQKLYQKGFTIEEINEIIN